MTEGMPERKAIRARERRRILLSKTLSHVVILLALLFLFESSSFFSKGQEASGQTPQGKSIEIQKDSVSQATISLVQHFEGYDPTCVDWLDGHATIGHGQLLHFGPCTAEDNALYVTREEARATLVEDLLFSKQRVQELVRVPINEKIESALISFAYNVGEGGLQDSTLLALLNAGDYRGAAEQFDLWINGPGGPLPGLIKRRAIEKEIFLEGLHHLK